jgi:succinate dehydrogenase/fumarate reductase flavoprotein subunit
MNKQKQKTGMGRRDFLALTGGTFAGIAALNAMGVQLEKNNATVNPDELAYKPNECDVLVIGGGMAGLFAAVKAHDAGSKVILVSKGGLGTSGQTPFAKGYFSYDATKESKSIDEFVAAVSSSAMGTNNETYTRQLAEHSKARQEELKTWGFFSAPICGKSFNKPIKERGINLIERVTITHLIKEDGKIAGAAGFDVDNGSLHFFSAKSVILCTGAGGFKPNGFPICDLTHDGTVMAYNIGAKVTGKEWNDGHSARTTNPAACYDGWGDMFNQIPGTTGVEIHHDLGVDLNYIAYKGGGPVQMGPGMESSSEFTGGPTVPAAFQRVDNGSPPGGSPPPGKKGSGGKEGGGPPGMMGASVGGASAGMSIHKSEGLSPINDQCASTIPGLYAAGDALGSHMAGGIYTQIGSSLAGSAVQGAIAGEAASAYAANRAMPAVSTSRMQEIKAEIVAPLKREKGYSPAWVTQTLQGIMIPNFVIYIKKEKMLQAALAYVEELRDHHIPMLIASDLHELRLAHETANMIYTAEMKLRASLMRKESRCSHYRLDYPETDETNWNAWINIYKGADGSMQLEKQPFGTWAKA